jgi:shikimate dehydrogenase
MLKLALLGHPVAHSRSPAVHAAFGRQCGIALHYALIDVADGEFEAALASFIAAGGRGANVTLPFKLRAAAVAQRLSRRAAAAGAVNALKLEDDGSISGDNTDGAGLLRDLAHNHGLALGGLSVALLGGSGAARGALAALLAAGARVRVADRDAARRAKLARDFPAAVVGDYAALAGARVALTVNATSASLRGELPPLPDGVLAEGSTAYDLVYADGAAVFQRWALAAGAARALDGWGMMVEQAAASFELWTGLHPATEELLHRGPSQDRAPR